MSDKTDFTTRTLMALVNELAALQQTTANLAAQIGALAKEHGVSMVNPDDLPNTN